MYPVDECLKVPLFEIFQALKNNATAIYAYMHAAVGMAAECHRVSMPK